MNRPGTSLALGLCLLLFACSSAPPLPQALLEFSDGQKEAARAAEQAGRLAEALSLWRTLLPVDARDKEVLAAIASLDLEIARRSKRALAKGRSAYARGDSRSGDTWMLKVLALQPGQKQALERLRQSVSGRAQQKQVAKTSEEYATETAPVEDVPVAEKSPVRGLYDAGDHEAVVALAPEIEDDDEESARLLRLSYIALADKAKGQEQSDLELQHLQAAINTYLVVDDPLLNRSAKLRIALSNEWYLRGNTLLHADLRQAIAALEKSVLYNPENRAARLKLQQARTLRRNLERIQGK